MDKETILSYNHLFTASEVHFLKTGDLEEDKNAKKWCHIAQE